MDFRHIRDQSLFNLGGGAAAGDYNGDGLLDIYVTNSAGSNALYRNNGDGTFTDVAATALSQRSPKPPGWAIPMASIGPWALPGATTTGTAASTCW